MKPRVLASVALATFVAAVAPSAAPANVDENRVVVSGVSDGGTGAFYVAEFTLLLSPDAFDFSQPVKVEANGRVVFNGRVDRSVATLLKWAGRDTDRTMVFAAELLIKL